MGPGTTETHMDRSGPPDVWLAMLWTNFLVLQIKWYQKLRINCVLGVSYVCVDGAELAAFVAGVMHLAHQLDGQAAQKQLELCSCRQFTEAGDTA